MPLWAARCGGRFRASQNAAVLIYHATPPWFCTRWMRSLVKERSINQSLHLYGHQDTDRQHTLLQGMQPSWLKKKKKERKKEKRTCTCTTREKSGPKFPAICHTIPALVVIETRTENNNSIRAHFSNSAPHRFLLFPFSRKVIILIRLHQRGHR